MAGKQDRINQLKRAEKVHSSITGLGQKQIEQVNDYLGKLDNLISKEKERWSWGRKTRIQAADQAKEILNFTREIEGEEEEINKILDDRLKTVQKIFHFDQAMTREERKANFQNPS